MLSVIIPTYQRPDKIADCLKALAAQTLVKALDQKAEILVMADGLDDPSRPVVEALAPLFEGHPVFSPLTYRALPHAGQATARNVALRAARCPLVAFIGDDIVCPPNWLESHVDWHRGHPAPGQSLLGLILLHPRIKESLLLKHLYGVGGQQFSFINIKPGDRVTYGFFYTSNLSLKRDFLLRQGLFDESFSDYGMEDTELGYRLSRAGLELYYSDAAPVWHDHDMDFAQALERQRAIGRAIAHFRRLHPGLWKKVLEGVAEASEEDYERFRLAAAHLCDFPFETLKGVTLNEKDASGTMRFLAHQMLQGALVMAQRLGLQEAMRAEETAKTV